jgi:hypothetical protein
VSAGTQGDGRSNVTAARHLDRRPGGDELADIRRLLILLLLKAGATSAEIGDAIGLDGSTVRHMVKAPRKK